MTEELTKTSNHSTEIAKLKNTTESQAKRIAELEKDVQEHIAAYTKQQGFLDDMTDKFKVSDKALHVEKQKKVEELRQKSEEIEKLSKVLDLTKGSVTNISSQLFSKFFLSFV